MIGGLAIASELAELVHRFRFTLRDCADGGPVTVDAVTEIVLVQGGPAITDDFTKVSVGLCIADCQRPFDLEAKASGLPSRASEVNNHIVERLATVALLDRDAAYHSVLNPGRKCLRQKRRQVEGCDVAFVGKACAPGQFRRLRQRIMPPYGVIVLFGRPRAIDTSNGKVASNRAMRLQTWSTNCGKGGTLCSLCPRMPPSM